MQHKRISLSAKQRHELGDMLLRVCHLRDGNAVYDEGWSDRVVAHHFTQNGVLMSDASVRNLRAALIGELPHKSPNINMSELRLRVERLEARLFIIEEALTNPSPVTRQSLADGLRGTTAIPIPMQPKRSA